MAYSVKYLFKFESSNGTTREIRVLQDGYTGEVIQRPLGRAPVLKKQQNGPVHGTSLEFYAECNVDREFIEFYTSDPKAYRVDLYAGATLLWQGYITPELYSEPDIAPPYDVRVVATDGVGELKLYDYTAQGTVSLRALLSGLLARTGLGTDIYLISSLKAGSRGAGALLDMTINLDYMAGESCYDVLTYLLDTLHATITWWKGAWILSRETNVTFTSGKVRYFNTAGNSALLADSVQTLGSLRANPAWPVGQLSTVIDPAKNRVTVQAPWHVVTGLQNSDMTSDASWAKSNDASYGPDGYLFPNNDEGASTYATAYISQALAMEGLRVPMSFELRATGVSAQVGVRVGAAIGVLLTYTVGNVVYHLRKGSEGAPEWTPGPAIGTTIDGSLVDYQRPLASFDMDRIQAETLQITDIPAFVQGTSYPSGTLTVYILGTCARVYAATLDVVLPKGYQDILRIDNGARGEGGEVEIAIGRVTADNAYYAAFLQGLLLDSGNLITSFSDANFPGGMDYLAFIARDYALSVALPRAKVTGTVYLESGIAAPPLVFTKGALNYWLQTWSWNLYEDELEIEGLTLPSASLTVESETILESNGSTVSSAGGAGSSSAGSSMGGGVGTNYWEIDGTLNTLLKPKDAYAYVHSKDGLFFTGAALSGTVVPDLYVDIVNDQRVLRSPLPLITGGDQIVIDGTPGGGGGGGGATTLAGLDDTNITNPQAGQMLSWNGTKWVNTNAPTGSITSVSLAAGESNGTLHLVVNGTAQSDVAVTGLKALAYKDSLAFSEITGTASASQIPTLAISKISGLQTALDGKQPLDADLTAIAGLTGTSGFLKKTAANTWALDTNTYLTTGTAASTYQPLDSDLTQIAAISTGTGLLKRSVSGSTVSWTIDTNTYLTGNQTITLSGDVSGSGTTAITTTIGEGKVTNAMLAGSIANAKLANSAITINGSSTSLGGSFNTASITAGTAGTSGATSGYTLAVPYVTVNKYGIVTGYGTHTHTVNSIPNSSLANSSITIGSTAISLGGTAASLAGLTNVSMSGKLTIGSAEITYDATNGYLYINKPLVTAGDQIVISGTPGGGGGGGATTLAGLDDVAITSVANGQLLQYNGSKWVNVAASTVGRIYSPGTGISISASNVISLNSNEYYSATTSRTANTVLAAPNGSNGAASFRALVEADIPDLSGTYLPLNVGAGKTITSTSNAPLNINSTTTSTNEVGFRYQLRGENKAFFGYNASADYGAYMYNYNGPHRLGITDAGVAHFDGNALLHAGNYTSYVNTTNFPGLNKTGTVTSVAMTVPTGLSVSGTPITTSGTLAISLASGYSIPTTAKQSNWDTAYGWGNHASAGYLLATTAASTYVSSVALNGNYLRVTKNGTNTDLTIPYATNASRPRQIRFSQATDLNSALEGGGIAWNYGQEGWWTNGPSGMSYGSVLEVSQGSESLSAQFAWDIVHNVSAGTHRLWYRAKNNLGWGDWAEIYTSKSLTQSVVTGLIGSTTYAPYNANGYLPLNGGTMSNTNVVANLNADLLDGLHATDFVRWYNSTTTDFTSYFQTAQIVTKYGSIDGLSGDGAVMTIPTWKGSNANNYYNVQFVFDLEPTTFRIRAIHNGSVNYTNTVYTTANANLSTVDWACKSLTANNGMVAGGSTSGAYFGSASGGLGSTYTGGLAYVYGNNPLYFYTNGGNRMMITGGGNVGIGTTSPSQKLSVVGNIIASGYVSVGTGGANSYVGSDAATNIFLHNSSGHILVVDGVAVRRGATASTATLGTTTYPWAGITATSADFRLTNFTDFHIYRNNSAGSAGITYYSAAQTTNFWNVGMDPGNSPYYYRFYWYYNGNYLAYLTTTGIFVSTGDQVVSSDLTLKENLTPVTYSVADIAKARAVEFDWKDGRGHSMGSIAQDWLSIAPALVHGEEGNMSLAYGQLALVNTILLARQSESHEERIARLEKENAELKEEVKRLRMN